METAVENRMKTGSPCERGAMSVHTVATKFLNITYEVSKMLRKIPDRSNDEVNMVRHDDNLTQLDILAT